jgi:acyl-CoA thioester hydrolase
VGAGIVTEAKTKTPTETRDDYPYRLAIPTRWIDNDMLGHVNNVVFYRYFETIIVKFLIDCGLDWKKDRVVGFTVESLCRYWRPLSYPETIDAGLKVGRLGRTSCRYEIGLFGENSPAPAATGYFVHVFVDRDSEKPEPVPAKLRRALERYR